MPRPATSPTALLGTILVGASLLLAACQGISPPISVGQRDSLAEQGLVLTLTNTSDRHLHDVEITIVAPDGTEKIYVVPTLEPHESQNVGWLRLDGWPIPEDAKVSVGARDFPLKVRHRT